MSISNCVGASMPVDGAGGVAAWDAAAGGLKGAICESLARIVRWPKSSPSHAVLRPFRMM